MNKEKKKEKPRESWGERQHRMRKDIDEWIKDYTKESIRKNYRRDPK